MSKRRTKSPPPSKEDGGLRCSRIDGVRIGRAAGGLMASALQGAKRQARRRGETAALRKGLPAAQGAPESLVPAPPLGTYFPLRASSKMLSAMV